MDRNSWGFSLFSDDIRGEVAGKITVVGIYQGEMLFASSAEFPSVYPKFCILVKYYEVKDAFSDDIVVRIFLPGDAKDTPSVTVPIPASVRSGAPPPYPLEEDQESIFSLTYPIMLSPFLIKQEGFVKVRVVSGGITTNLGSLMIRKVRPDENIQIPAWPMQPVQSAPPTSPEPEAS
jgi:hypothetical protein